VDAWRLRACSSTEGLLDGEAQLCVCCVYIWVQVDAFLRKWAPLIRSRGEQFMAQP
jgi:hypothetical protein